MNNRQDDTSTIYLETFSTITSTFESKERLPEERWLQNEGQAGGTSPDSLHVENEEEQLGTEEINHGLSDDEAKGVNESFTEFDKEIFLEEVREFPCLWDTNVASYKERPTKANAWKELSKIFKDGNHENILTILYCTNCRDL